MSAFRRPGVLARRYPAIALAFAATAVAIVPLTASAATTTTASTSASASAAQVKASAAHSAAAKKSAEAKKDAAAKSAAKSTTSTKTTAKAEKATTASVATTAAAAVSTSPYAGVSYSELEPTGTDGSQQTFTATSEQWANATAIVKASKDLNLSAYAAVIAVATAMQESSLRNLTTATNADSLGLFQQRPSMGWGTASELTDPTYAAKAFLRELPSDYEGMDLASAAQSVQRSFDGSLYAQWESQAAHMVYSIANA